MLRCLLAKNRWWFLLPILIGIALVGSAGSVAATPQVIRSTPIDGEILKRSPAAITLGFDQPISAEASSIAILDLAGEPVGDISLSWDADFQAVTISVADSLDDAVYTISWHLVGAVDGAESNSWSSFSIGNPEDANIITIPTSDSRQEAVPLWLHIATKTFAYLGVSVAIAIWPAWRGIVRPALAKHRSHARLSIASTQRWATMAISFALITGVADLLVESRQQLHDLSFLNGIMQMLGHNEWGFWWLARMAFVALLGIGLALTPWWFPRRVKMLDASLWLISFTIPLTLVFVSHASRDAVGHITLLAAGYLSLTALLLLLGTIVQIGVTIPGGARAAISASIRSRLAWLAIVTISIALITGIYLAGVYIGNRAALQETPFGRLQVVQILIAFPAVIVVIVAIRFLDRSTGSIFTAAIAVALLVVPMAGMDVVPPARAELVSRAAQTREDLEFDGRPGIFLVAPGRAGVNHLRLETPGTYLQTETSVFVDAINLDHPELGNKSIQMYRVQGNAFEHHGTEFSVMGNWQLAVRIEEPGFPSSIATYEQAFDRESDTYDLPDPPLKFNTLSGLAGLSLILAAILGIGTSVVVGNNPIRKEAMGISIVALGFAAVLLVQGRIDPLLVVESGAGGIDPKDVAMVARGRDTFATYCISCHGVNLRGDGPLADALQPPPADFAAPHTKVHRDEDFIYWIQYGIQGTAMPGFRSQLDDQDIRDVIAYIKYWQKDDGASEGAATPEVGLSVCRVAPLTIADLEDRLANATPTRGRNTALARAIDSTVTPDRTNDVMMIVEQLSYCANQDQYLSQLALLSDGMLLDLFPEGVTDTVRNRALQEPQPVAPAAALTVQDVQSVNLLSDGRIAVNVIFSDPGGIGLVPGGAPVNQTTLVFVNQNGTWLLDEIR